MATTITSYTTTYQNALNKQASSGAKVYKGGWVSATKDQINNYLNPSKSSSGDALFQHMLLSYNNPIGSITVAGLNNYLSGKGVLSGKGSSFIEAANTYKVNPIYLAMHASVESGNGTSALARGTVLGYKGYYNVYGIGAYDNSAQVSGAKTAKNNGWNTVSKAIVGGAKFVAENYISAGQDTLYKMRWNPANPGTHQYATDISWAQTIGSMLASTVKTMGVNSSSLNYNISNYSDSSVSISTESKGYKLITKAKEYLGVPYVYGGNGPNSFDCSGYVKYLFNTVLGYDMTARTAFTQQKLGKTVTGQPMAGDLVFFTDTYNTGNVPNISHVGIMLGDGDSFIQASGSKVNISNLSNSYWKSHYYSTKRLLDESETFSEGSATNNEYSSSSDVDYVTGLSGGLPLTKANEYEDELEDALEYLDSSNNSNCSLIDLTRDGEFKFYLPESYTESIPVSWDMTPIHGRSVPPVGYNNSGPRSVPIEVTLMAGAGYYSNETIATKGSYKSSIDDSMDKMYKDISFVRSLVYPDYSYNIVQPPSRVLLSCGSYVRLEGVITGCNVTYLKPLDYKNRSMQVHLSFTVSQVSDDPPSYGDIRNQSN